MQSHDQSVTRQFDSRAQAYLTSTVHATGADLAWVRQWLARWAPTRTPNPASATRAAARALDVGCGAGHLGFLLADHFADVTLVDPSPSMLSTALAEAARRGFTTVQGEVARAEQLPFKDDRFDLVASRFSAHHWGNVPAALKQLRRLVKAGGRLLMIDLLGDESPLVDTHLQTLEVLRDPSHVRDYSATQWQAMIAAAGFTVLHTERWPLRMDFASWTARMHTPPAAVEALKWVIAHASKEVHEALAIEVDGSFTPNVGLLVAEAGGSGS
jgi:ubiquinone/menaquinone biosynthesis C-methylase UbiE